MESSRRPFIIVVFQDIDHIREIKNQICYGIEEEGMEFKEFIMEEEKEFDSSAIFYYANQSIIGISIGIGSKEIIVHYNKMDKDKPVFIHELDKFHTNMDKEMFINIGKNAARLAKNKAFIDMNKTY